MAQLQSDDILLAAFIASLCGMTMYVVLSEGNIFEGLGNIVRKHIPEFLQKPIATCPICMSFWYGLIFHILFLHTDLLIGLGGSLLSIGLTALAVGSLNVNHDDDN